MENKLAVGKMIDLTIVGGFNVIVRGTIARIDGRYITIDVIPKALAIVFDIGLFPYRILD